MNKKIRQKILTKNIIKPSIFNNFAVAEFKSAMPKTNTDMNKEVIIIKLNKAKAYAVSLLVASTFSISVLNSFILSVFFFSSESKSCCLSLSSLVSYEVKR